MRVGSAEGELEKWIGASDGTEPRVAILHLDALRFQKKTSPRLSALGREELVNH